MCKQCRIEAGHVIPPRRPRTKTATPPRVEEPADEVVVERLVAGDPVRATSGERAEAVRCLDRYGYSTAQIAQRLRVSTRTVERLRTKTRLAA